VDLALRDRFLDRWHRHFGPEELPLTFYYTDREAGPPPVVPAQERRCIMAELTRARRGEPLRFDADSFGCAGGRRYAGFDERLRPDFEYFLSCGIPGRMEGERYKKTPEIVRDLLARAPSFRAPARFVVVKRWDLLDGDDDPAVAIFFARPDALSGLFTLAGYRGADDAVIAPFGAGCSTILQRPYLERDRESPRAVLGMFDVSARPHVPHDTLTFSVPISMLAGMIDDMDESFLITGSWGKVRRRLEQTARARTPEAP